jgi:hypothetical protein
VAGLIAEAARRAAHPGGVRFVERQLYYEVCRLLRPAPLGDGFPHTAPPAVPYGEFREALAAGEAPPGLLADDARPPLPLEGREPDLTAYGLPRLLVCHDPAVVRMLVANGFHMELSCAVVAAWPPPEHLAAMLARTRHARAYALHDASPEGLAWAAALGATAPAPLREIGLRPAHAMRLRLVATRGERRAPESLPAALSPVERAWLAEGWSAEVAALSPSRLLRTLRRIMLGIAAPAEPERPRADAGFLTMP